MGGDVRLAHRCQLLVGAPAVGQSTSEPGELPPACRTRRNITSTRNVKVNLASDLVTPIDPECETEQ